MRWMDKTLVTTFLLLLAGGMINHSPAQGPAPRLELQDRYEQIVIVHMERDTIVNDDLRKTLRTHIENTAAMGVPVALVLSIDSGGGSVPAAESIVEVIQSYTEHDQMRILAYVQRQALSAAAWIAMACEGLLISPNAQFGDIQPLIGSFRGYERAPEKVVTKLTEQIWLSCRNNGIEPRYPRLFIEGMVDKDIEIVAVENLRTRDLRYMRSEDFDALTETERTGLARHSIGLPGKALTTNGADMPGYGFSIRLLDHENKIVDILGTPDADVRVIRIENSGAFGLAFDWSWLLVMAGLMFLVIEIKSPGLGAFGILGILCLVAFFFIQTGWSEESYIPVALLLAGVFLIILEILVIPGFGLAGISGILLVLYGTYAAVAADRSDSLFPDFGSESDRVLVRDWATYLSCSLVGGIAGAFAFGRFIHRIPFLNKMVLSTAGLRLDANRNETSRAASSQGPVSISVGDRGEAVTDLRPSGRARLGGKTVDVVAEGLFIAADTQVVVQDVEGFRVVVRAVDGDGGEG